MTHAVGAAESVSIAWRGRRVRIEVRRLGREREDRPLAVFLHEGLGSASMWKDWPKQLCDEAGLRGLVYSRPGYGQSTPRVTGERWSVDYMHRQADEVLPALLDALGIDAAGDAKPWLIGHSDGASIALLYAARRPQSLAGLVVLAPHIFVEEYGLQSIHRARAAYREGDLRSRLGKYHADPDSAFWGWNDIWLDPAFARWNIEDELAAIECPLLAVQGEDDEYGTLAQLEGIAAKVKQTRLLVLPDCGHSPHRDRPEALTRGVAAFIAEHERNRPSA